MGYHGLRFQVKPLKGDQNEGDQFTKKDDQNVLRERICPRWNLKEMSSANETKKRKNVTTEIEKIANLD